MLPEIRTQGRENMLCMKPQYTYRMAIIGPTLAKYMRLSTMQSTVGSKLEDGAKQRKKKAKHHSSSLIDSPFKNVRQSPT
mmetsp:Transcript_37492/g.58568  ORF Transcript_37492/g.58568 Transcript_37492/m.58568 type:complete len:80 (-) Transcript_37492:257-496(-)